MDEPSTAEESTPPSNRRVAGTRRSFLRWAGIAAAGTAVVATGAKALSSGGSGGGSAVAANTSPLPTPVATLPPQLRSLASTPNLNIEGITPLMTPNDDFFRIDTALSVPRVDLANWRLEIKGNVRTPFSISYDELLAMPQVEAPITLACVSNRVGGTLIGTAMWQGVELRTLLDRAGVEPSGEQIVGTS
ncbi:MAG: molybdopterin-dependent oxidoreductase, partial [Actinobacteria bacterium]|nr:molybdopterin-dependent oxidoreductase [Actinomycetota bacterium]